MNYVRSLLFWVYFALWSTIIALAMLPTFLRRREAVLGWARRWQRGIEIGLERICGIGVELRGTEHIPTGPAIVAAKHQCMFDAFAPLTQLRRPCLVAKEELARIPFLGWYGAYGRLLLAIDRGGHSKALRQLVSEARDALSQGRQLVIFPEGTRARLGAPPAYKSGVAALYGQLEVPCVPLATNAGVHWRTDSILRVPGTIIFEYLPPIPPGLDRRQFMKLLEERIETATAALLRE